MYRCRYHAPGDAGPFEVTVTPFADGDGAVVTHRAPPHNGRQPNSPLIGALLGRPPPGPAAERALLGATAT